MILKPGVWLNVWKVKKAGKLSINNHLNMKIVLTHSTPKKTVRRLQGRGLEEDCFKEDCFRDDCEFPGGGGNGKGVKFSEQSKGKV